MKDYDTYSFILTKGLFNDDVFEQYSELSDEFKKNLTRLDSYYSVESILEYDVDDDEKTNPELVKAIGDIAYACWLRGDSDESSIQDIAVFLANGIKNGWYRLEDLYLLKIEDIAKAINFKDYSLLGAVKDDLKDVKVAQSRNKRILNTDIISIENMDKLKEFLCENHQTRIDLFKLCDKYDYADVWIINNFSHDKYETLDERYNVFEHLYEKAYKYFSAEEFHEYVHNIDLDDDYMYPEGDGIHSCKADERYLMDLSDHELEYILKNFIELDEDVVYSDIFDEDAEYIESLLNVSRSKSKDKGMEM